MNFAYPEIFYVAIIWVLLCFLVSFNQALAVNWLKTNVSDRFFIRFTRYTGIKLICHVLIIFFAGLSLIWILAGPYKMDDIANFSDARNIIIVIDSSQSMSGKDTYKLTDDRAKSLTRFEAAKIIAYDFVTSIEKDKIGLISFSGQSTLHATPTLDHQSVKSLIKNLTLHSVQGSGSAFAKPFAEVLHVAQFKPDQYVVVLISDGEPTPADQNYSEELQTLKTAGIPVFTVGVGSEDGASISIMDPMDIYNKVDTPRVVKVVTSYRDAKTLEKIADETDGQYFELESGDWVKAIIEALPKAGDEKLLSNAKGKVDNTSPAILVFLILFFLEILFLFPRKITFTVFILAFSTNFVACDTRIFKAHNKNEDGISRYEMALFDEARNHFEMSYFFRIKEEIPLLNLGNNAIEIRNFGLAHTYYQRAIRTNPDIADAYFNDGVAFFLWAEDEIDPSGCFLARSAELYDQAIERFKEAHTHGINTDRNIEYIKKRIADLYELNRSALNCPQSSDYNYDSKNKPQDQDQNQNQDKNKDQDQKQNQNQNQNQNQDKNSGHDQKLSNDEQRQVESELQRIRSQADDNLGFKQSDNQQDPNTEADVDKEVLW